MNAPQWLGRLFGRSRSCTRRVPAHRLTKLRPWMEELESRCVPTLSITTPTLPAWTAGQSVLYKDQWTIRTSGGTGSITFATTAGTLPTGLSLVGSGNPTGYFYGTPTTPGTYSFTVTATDSVRSSASQSYTVTINPPVSLQASSLPDWTVNQPGYSQTIKASGGTGQVSFCVSVNFAPLSAKLPTGREFISAAAEANGTVYAIGGSTSSGLSSEVDAYNPSTTSWSPVASLPTARQLLAATTGTDGTIYAIGGQIGTALSSEVDAYNPKTNTWATVASLPTARAWLAATTGADGTIYAIGGNATLLGSSSEVDAYNPKTNTWATVASLPTARARLAAATGSDGTIYAIGGIGNTWSNAEWDAYNPRTNTWSTVPTLSGAWWGLAAAAGSDGTIYAIGGIGQSSPYSNAGELREVIAYSPSSGKWRIAGALPTRQAYMSAAISNGTIYSVGGDIYAPGSGLSYDVVNTVTLTPPGLTLSSTGVLSGTPTAAGTFTFTVTATDAVGASGSQTYTATINPGPLSQYLVSVAGYGKAQAGTGSLVTVQAADQYGNPITKYSGPASVTAFIAPGSVGSGFPRTVPINSAGLGLFVANILKTGTYTMSVTDSTGTYFGSALSVTVTAGSAAKLAFGSQPQDTPTGDILPPVTVQVEDVYGNLATSDDSDTVTLAVVSGPGPFLTRSQTSASVGKGVAIFSNLTLTALGSYMLSEQVPGLYTGPNSNPFTITPLQVIPASFAGTPSGFSLQFNAPFLVNSATPVLYGQGAPVPSVTLTQTMDMLGNAVNNPIAGSLVLDSANNRLRFLATNTTLYANTGSPLLPDGTYVATIHASAATNGVQAQNSGGGYLDGLATGTAGSGDYTNTFTVYSGGEDVVWVPATADGPGQALRAPGMNALSAGYPIYLNNLRSTVTNVQVTLHFDPKLLFVTGVAGANFSLRTLSPGQVTVQYNGPALPVGSKIPIGFITAIVSKGTPTHPLPYRAVDLLDLSNVTLNGGALSVATSHGLHLVAYAGDTDGNGSYSGNDAMLITRVLLRADTGFAAFPLIDPVIVADTDGAGFIPADAALQVNEAGVGAPTANLPSPPIPGGVYFKPLVRNAHASASIQPRPATVEAYDGVSGYELGGEWVRLLAKRK